MKPGAPFTAKEDSFLSLHYRDMETDKLASTLGRTLSSTQSRLRHLGLRKRESDKPTQTRVTVLFDEDLMPRIRQAADEQGMSMSGYVQELVRAGLPRAKKKKA